MFCQHLAHIFAIPMLCSLRLLMVSNPFNKLIISTNIYLVLISSVDSTLCLSRQQTLGGLYNGQVM